MGLLGGVLVAMWNYMGWDNASTIAQEVERPQRTYPKAMIAAVVLVALTYVFRFWRCISQASQHRALRKAHGRRWRGRRREDHGIRMAPLLHRARRDDERVRHVQRAGDELFAAASCHGMGRNVAENFGKTSERTNAPWFAILVCATCWALCLGLGFSRLITLDIMLYGLSLSLEFVTLVVLRIREPNLKREFKVPADWLA